MRSQLFVILMMLAWIFTSCNKDVKEFVTLFVDTEASSDLPHLNSAGEEVTPNEGNIAVSPLMVRQIAVQYIELVPDEATAYKDGEVIFKAPETYASGDLAIDFDSLLFGGPGSTIFELNLRKIQPGTYKYLRAGIAYISYDIGLNILGLGDAGDQYDQQATFASFLAFNTYVRDVQINELTKTINDDRVGGYWLLETGLLPPLDSLNTLFSWQIPQEALTVVNVLTGVSPVPPGQSVITGAFDTPMEILEDEDRNLRIKLNLSVNGIFEFEDLNGNGVWDFQADNIFGSEPVVDFGVRGMQPGFSFE